MSADAAPAWARTPGPGYDVRPGSYPWPGSIRRVAFEKQKASLVGSRTGTRCGSIRRVAVRLREAEGVVAPGAVHLHVFRHRTAAVHEGVMIGADAAPADPMIYATQWVSSLGLLVGFAYLCLINP